MESFNTISINRWWNKYGVIALWVLGVLSLSVALAYTSWTIYTQSQLKRANYQVQEVAPLAAVSKPSYRVNDIISANLFGDPRPKPVVKQAPKTTLDLTLQGILWASDPNLARAIIMTGKKNSELYSIGENIKGAGASIKEIRSNEVLLNRNGATESLPLVKKTISSDQQLVSYSGQAAGLTPVNQLSSNRVPQNNQRASSKARAPNGAPRKVRKPNFNGLDRALKKMGEL